MKSPAAAALRANFPAAASGERRGEVQRLLTLAASGVTRGAIQPGTPAASAAAGSTCAPVSSGAAP